MANKTPVRKSKTAVVVYFGSADNFDMPSDLDYKTMQTRLGEITNPDDIRALPSTIAGNKLVKIQAESVVIIDGDRWGFKPTRSARSRPDIQNDPYVAKAIAQLDSLLLTGKPRFVLVPYYARLEKL